MGDMPFALYGPDMYQVQCHTLGDVLADCDSLVRLALALSLSASSNACHLLSAPFLAISLQRCKLGSFGGTHA